MNTTLVSVYDAVESASIACQRTVAAAPQGRRIDASLARLLDTYRSATVRYARTRSTIDRAVWQSVDRAVFARLGN